MASIPFERSFEVTEGVLRTVFNHLYAQRVLLEGMILKPNMVLAGLTSPKQEAVDEVADATVKCLLSAVPAAVPGIAFLSGRPTRRPGLSPFECHETTNNENIMLTETNPTPHRAVSIQDRSGTASPILM